MGGAVCRKRENETSTILSHFQNPCTLFTLIFKNNVRAQQTQLTGVVAVDTEEEHGTVSFEHVLRACFVKGSEEPSRTHTHKS